METRAKFLEEITDINENYNTDLIGRAFETARGLHDGQLRKSGEPYLIHPIAVAKILAQLGMDDETIVGGLLHDVVEDTEYTREQLVEDFSEEVALLVDGVTKLGAIKFDTKEEAQADGAELIEPTTDEVTYSDGTTDEVYGFDIPVEKLDEDFNVAIIGKKGTWYDHVVSVSNPVPQE